MIKLLKGLNHKDLEIFNNEFKDFIPEKIYILGVIAPFLYVILIAFKSSKIFISN